jgi:tetratricopeptide (TPR) repeat protein
MAALLVTQTFPQEKDIIPYLKLIESGQKDSVQKLLPDLQKSYPEDPSILYLVGVLTENGQDAVPIFNRIIADFPKSKYADAAEYRLYSYYYSLGLYKTASVFLDKLKKNYPNSPYIKIAGKDVPAEDEETTSLSNTVPKDTSGNFKYTIQAGAFSEDSNAVELKKRFENSGYYSLIKKKTVGGSDFSVVFVGQFQDREEADNFLQLVNKQFGLKGRVVPINQ